MSYLSNCLKSVLATNYPRFEVIVVDNASTDGSRALIKTRFPTVKLIENESNFGFCKANNEGIKASSGNVVVLLNNDTVVDSNWLNEIAESLKDPMVGVVGCRLYYPGTNTIQTLGYREKFPGYWIPIGEGCSDSEKRYEVGPVDYACGAVMGIKREVLTKVGYLDETLGSFGDDLEFCLRARRAGFHITTSRGVVYHYGSMSWRSFPVKKVYFVYRNSTYILGKYYPPRAFLAYLFYPLFTIKTELQRIISGRTVAQRVEVSQGGRSQTTFARLVIAYTLNTTMFMIGMMWWIMKGSWNEG